VAEIKVTSFADIEPVELEAVWQGIALAGTVNVLAGPGGSGKSFLGYDLAARVSQGREMPDGSPGAPPSNVVIVGLEDSPEASAVHRLTEVRAEVHDDAGLAAPAGQGRQGHLAAEERLHRGLFLRGGVTAQVRAVTGHGCNRTLREE